eukprot:scaffold486_cov254-Pinguiococcus_pyrenoidosus.AAC.8
MASADSIQRDWQHRELVEVVQLNVLQVQLKRCSEFHEQFRLKSALDHALPQQVRHVHAVQAGADLRAPGEPGEDLGVLRRRCEGRLRRRRRSVFQPTWGIDEGFVVEWRF